MFYLSHERPSFFSTRNPSHGVCFVFKDRSHRDGSAARQSHCATTPLSVRLFSVSFSSFPPMSLLRLDIAARVAASTGAFAWQKKRVVPTVAATMRRVTKPCAPCIQDPRRLLCIFFSLTCGQKIQKHNRRRCFLDQKRAFSFGKGHTTRKKGPLRGRGTRKRRRRVGQRGRRQAEA